MDKIWLEHYPEEVETFIELDPKESLVDYFNKKTTQYSNKTAAECMGASITYTELNALSTKFALYCNEVLCLKKGDRLGIMSPNVIQYHIIAMGALKAGLVLVGINPLYTACELRDQILDSGLKVIVALDFFAHTLETAIQNAPIKHIVLLSIGGGQTPLKRFIINAAAKYIKKLIKPFNLPGAIYIKEIFKYKSQTNTINIKLSGTDLALIQYTGGTTGRPKGVMLSHANILANIYQVSACMKPIMTEDEIWIAPLPLYHIFALTASFAALNFGNKNIFITNPRDLSGLIKTITKSNFSIIIGVNTLFCALANDPRFKEANFSKLKVSWSGGMPVQEHVANKWKEVTKCPLHVAYGLSETSPGVSADFYNTPEFSNSIGFPFPNTDIEIRDINTNKVLPIGESGEICVKGPQVSSGYWNNEFATNESIINGWLKTGDVGVMNEKGQIKIVDRIKDMVIVSGFNVYTVEIEDVIGLIPQVLNVAVIGLPSDKSGEQLKAHVILKPNRKLTSAEIITHCRKHLTGYKIPRLISFNESLPLSPIGKILKNKLKELPENNKLSHKKQ
jgi:long-chain acyl-CoA synthetase